MDPEKFISRTPVPLPGVGFSRESFATSVLLSHPILEIAMSVYYQLSSSSQDQEEGLLTTVRATNNKTPSMER